MRATTPMAWLPIVLLASCGAPQPTAQTLVADARQEMNRFEYRKALALADRALEIDPLDQEARDLHHEIEAILDQSDAPLETTTEMVRKPPRSEFSETDMPLDDVLFGVPGSIPGVGTDNTAGIFFDNGGGSELRTRIERAPGGYVCPPVQPGPAPPLPEESTERYDAVKESGFHLVSDEPLSTFSIDVDTASYSNVRRFLTAGELPPPGAVRIEEMVNYFRYDYAPPEGDDPFAVHLEVAGCPWAPDHRLVRIGLKGAEIDLSERPPTNLVFLIDVSGSMDEPNKLPLLVRAFHLLVDSLRERDHVAIVVYAGSSGLVLPSTSGGRKDAIRAALDGLRAGGSTNGGEGIELAYRLAADHFVEGGTNRVVLATDGDFNVGVASRDELVRLVQEKAKSGVFLSVLGFGTGNLQDSQLEELADKGNGNYAYVDGLREAKKVLVEQMAGTLLTIAKDVKIQVEFNPALVAAHRLIGYENRALAHQDFNDDAKDAGEIGAGHTVTALYEIVPAGQDLRVPGVDPLRYQTARGATEDAATGELLTVKLRSKAPDGDTSRLVERRATDAGTGFDDASTDFRFAAAVAEFAMLLRDSEHRGDANHDAVLEIARSSLGDDVTGWRAEFLDLVARAKRIDRRDPHD